MKMFGLSTPVLDPSSESHEHGGSRARQLSEYLDRMASRTVDASDDHIDNTIETTLDEVRDVLSRPRLQRLSRNRRKTSESMWICSQRWLKIVEPIMHDPVIINDPGDDPILFTAVAAIAKCFARRTCDTSRHRMCVRSATLTASGCWTMLAP